MLFSLKGPNQTLCYAYVCDLTFCVSLVERLGRLRVTVSELEASQGGCFPTVALIPPPPTPPVRACYSPRLRFKAASDLLMRASLSYVFLFIIVELLA